MKKFKRLLRKYDIDCSYLILILILVILLLSLILFIFVGISENLIIQ